MELLIYLMITLMMLIFLVGIVSGFIHIVWVPYKDSKGKHLVKK
jgi:hypothetical protein